MRVEEMLEAIRQENIQLGYDRIFREVCDRLETMPPGHPSGWPIAVLQQRLRGKRKVA